MSRQGRPRTFSEQEVLESAMLVFWAHGYEASSVARLRSATGLSAASLYGAFGSKEGLFERVVAHYASGPGRVNRVIEDPSLDPSHALSALLHGTIAMQSEPQNPGGCLIALSATIGGADDGSSAARAAVSSRRTEDRAGIEACLRRGVEAGTFREDLDPKASAISLHSFILGVSTQLIDGVPPDAVHAAADVLLRGILRET